MGREGGGLGLFPEGPLYFWVLFVQVGICCAHAVGAERAYFRPWVERRPSMTPQGEVQDRSTVLKIGREAGGLSDPRGSGTREAYSAARHRLCPGPTDLRESPGWGAAPHPPRRTGRSAGAGTACGRGLGEDALALCCVLRCPRFARGALPATWDPVH